MSTSPHAMTDVELLDLYGKGRSATLRHDISGLTAYYRQNYCHIREGDPQQVSNSIIRAEATGWHYNIAVVYDIMAEERLFPKWFLSWVPQSDDVPRDHDQMIDLREHLNDPIFQIAYRDLVCSSFMSAFLDSFVTS